MTHLFAELLRHHDPVVLALVLLEAVLGGSLAMWLLFQRPLVGSLCAALSFALAVTLASWVVFRTALAGSYPQLRFVIPPLWAGPALALSLFSNLTAGLVHCRSRRSARSIMMSGSLLSCGFSCMLFTAMSGVVRPFALAYDLTAVLVTMILGAILWGFALWEGTSPSRRHRLAVSTGLVTLAIFSLAFGSLASILAFEAWMAAAGRGDDLASSPVAIIVAAEAVTVLVLSLFGSLLDNRVAARDRLEADRVRQLADSTLEGILIHRNGRIIDGNQSLAALIGFALADLRDSPVARLIPKGGDVSLWTAEPDAVLKETDVNTADGRLLPVEILSRSINYGGAPAVVTALHDVRERRASEAQIRFLAHHDMLTRLPNRVLLKETLELALQLTVRTQAPVAVLCLDLDAFKPVNDMLGHAAGDQLLSAVATRLRDSLGDGDFVARVGGDEFVVLQTTGTQPDRATSLAARIIQSLSAAFSIEGQHVEIGVSIGVAFCPQDGDNATSLLKRADIALYRAKEEGRGGFRLFESGMDMALRARQEMERDLRGAIQREELTLDFQPLFDSRRALVTFEALVRWTRPTFGPVAPLQFIRLAEDTGLIIPLGEWVLRTACAAAMTWSQGCRVAVNLSPAQFARGDLPGTVRSVLAETGLPAGRLELEVTEGVLIDNADVALAQLTELRAAGIRLVLDDFGTGYSSLSYLHRFPFDKLKVDRSFVERLEIDNSARAIVNAIISMSRDLDIEVTAEGVETIGQFEMLCAQGCHELQGFLLGRPMPQPAVDRFIRDRNEQLRVEQSPARDKTDPVGIISSVSAAMA